MAYMYYLAERPIKGSRRERFNVFNFRNEPICWKVLGLLAAANISKDFLNENNEDDDGVVKLGSFKSIWQNVGVLAM